VLDSTAVKMAPKIFEKVGVLLQRREPKHVKYDYDAHMHLEAQGFFNEGLEGIFRCPTKGCKNNVSLYRQVRRNDDSFHDVLRFEQTIPVAKSSKMKSQQNASAGKVSFTVPVVWNGEHRKKVQDTEYIGEVRKAGGRSYVLFKQRYFTSVTCVVCRRELHLWDELRRFDGDSQMRWVLAMKEGNLSVKDVEDGEAQTLVNE